MKKTITLAALAGTFMFAGATIIPTLAQEATLTTQTQTKSASKKTRTMPDYTTLLETQIITFEQAQIIAEKAAPTATIVEYDFDYTDKNTTTPTYTFELVEGTNKTEITINAIDGTVNETETETTSEKTTVTATISLEAAQTTALATVTDGTIVGYQFEGDAETPHYDFKIWANETITRVRIDALTGEKIETTTKNRNRSHDKSDCTNASSTDTTETATSNSTTTADSSTATTDATSSATTAQ